MYLHDQTFQGYALGTMEKEVSAPLEALLQMYRIQNMVGPGTVSIEYGGGTTRKIPLTMVVSPRNP